MITIDNVKEHLGDEASKYDDGVLTDVLAAEASAQRSRLAIPERRPVVLDEALLSRVAYNLAETGGKKIIRCGIEAEGVRELEAPFSRRRAHEPASEQGSPKTRAKRGAKKAVAAPVAPNQESE